MYEFAYGLQLIATLCCAVFAGAAVYVALVEHPARIECGTEVAIMEFIPSYRRGALLQGSLAAVGSLTGIVGGLMAHDWFWLAGGLLLLAVIPLTLLVIFPVNHRLHDPQLDRESPEAETLLRRWGDLHAIRTIVGVAALLLFLLS